MRRSALGHHSREVSRARTQRLDSGGEQAQYAIPPASGVGGFVMGPPSAARDYVSSASDSRFSVRVSLHLVAHWHSRSAETLPVLRSLDGGIRLRLEGCQRWGSSWNNGRVQHASPTPRVPSGCQLTSKSVARRIAQLAQLLARSPPGGSCSEIEVIVRTSNRDPPRACLRTMVPSLLDPGPGGIFKLS
jgi:hypothetical protein